MLTRLLINAGPLRIINVGSMTIQRFSTSNGLLAYNGNRYNLRQRKQNVVLYATAFTLFAFAMSYAAVPLYRIYCQQTGKGGQAVADTNVKKIKKMKFVKDRLITVKFNADTNAMSNWNFKPLNPELKVLPGETALAFFSARNPLDVPIDGISTYNVVPYEAGLYLNKIQCFCFEEQRLNPKEEVELPVFFYIDPEYAEDPRLENVDEIVLSYTFFDSKPKMSVPFFEKFSLTGLTAKG